MEQRYYSNIYWHFTGSPKGIDWGRCKKPKDILLQGKPQHSKEALNTLFAIFESETLLARCNERISEKLSTKKFCCVTDIPLFDLNLHAKYYGKIAIGFNCSHIHTQFNPVLYYPNVKFPRKCHIPKNGSEVIVDDYDDIDIDEFNVEKLSNGQFRLTLKGMQGLLFTTEIETGLIDNDFINYLKITNFSSQIGESFYQEREWRCTNDFSFNKESIEAIIVPKYLKNKAQQYIYKSRDYKHVSIFTWEFLRQA